MALYIYCPRPSDGALELVKALGARRLRRFDGLNFWDKRAKFHVAPGDSIVCWGAAIPDIDGVSVLNSDNYDFSKLDEIKRLTDAGVYTVKVGQKVSDYGEVMLGRKIYHQGGLDLLDKGTRADYYVVKETFTTEYRVHSFAGRSIRAGVKVARRGFEPCAEAAWKPGLLHPWIRSYDGGWIISYTGFASTPKLRTLAARAVKALGLTFGAVDIGENHHGTLKVLEVNRSPGIEGGTTAAYVRAINRWFKEGGANDVAGDDRGEPNPFA